MKNTNALPLQILEILYQYPDPEHLISMPELQAILETEGFPSNRRTVYRAIETLREYNHDIRYEFHKFYSGYYLVPYFDEAEHFILSDYLNQLCSLSNKEVTTQYKQSYRHLQALITVLNANLVHAQGVKRYFPISN